MPVVINAFTGSSADIDAICDRTNQIFALKQSEESGPWRTPA